MAKEDESSERNWKYDGDEAEWDSFDRRMIRHMRKKLDDIGEQMWLGEIGSVFGMAQDEYEKHCKNVMKAIYCTDPSEARKLKEDMSEFEDPDWQFDWMKRQYTLMADFIESHCKGQAEVEMINYAGDLKDIRKHLYKQFGSGSGGNIHEKEIDYDRGMPEKGKAAFPAGCDMGEKLRQLESRRLYFLKMAGSAELRKTYVYCQESKLVRIVLEHVNKNEYGDCVKRVLELVKMQKIVKKTMDGDASAIDAIPDNHARSFSDDWLPSWNVLKASLLAEWSERCISGNKAKETNKGVLPVAMGNVKSITCYGCGQEGHKKGDPSCKAGKYDVHASAPKDYKERMAKGRKREAEKKQNPKSPGANNKKGEDKEKKHCHAFNFGKGNCRYGAKCRYLHEKGEGGGKMKGFTPEQQKLVSTLLSSAMKRTASAIAKKNKKARKKLKASKDKDDSENESEDFSAMLASCLLAPIRNSIRRDLRTKDLVVMAANLHSVHKNCGIDSDAGMSISTLRDDFIWIDESDKAKESIESPAGINGGSSTIAGRGPMIVRAKSGQYLIDPDAVYLQGGKDQPNFRVMSTQRLKMHGVRSVGCFKGTETDVLQDRTSKETIELSEEGPEGKRILVLETCKCPVLKNMKVVKQLVEEIRNRNRSAMVQDIDQIREDEIEMNAEINEVIEECGTKGIPTSVMAFNLAKISDEERSRLFCRRFGYCNTQLLKRMSEDSDFGEVPKLVSLNEDNAILDAAKFKKKAHYRNDAELSMGRPPWFRVYVDGAGGGMSMGCESYEGAIGSYLFVCSSTGEIHHKLYASHEQFPAALFQFLVHVEGEGNRCHEIYCDTFSANISAEVEEVAALFLVKIIPVSAGTPQEVSFVETAHRTIAGRSRAMMLGAPHLPKWCWALSDKHAVYVGRLLPQSTREWKCSYFLNTLKAPDWRHMFVHVFGAPCAFSPVEGPVHKRAAQTVDGYYVGVQHPMVLVLRKEDMKLISVSKKKIIVYESMYVAPLSLSSDRLGEAINGRSIEELRAATIETSPRHVQSIKSMSSHQTPVPNTTAHERMRPPTKLDESADTQSPSQGEGVIVPEHLSYDDDLETGIRALKEKAMKTISDPGIRKKVIDSITNLQDVSSRVVEPKQLKVGKKTKSKIDQANIILGKRRRRDQEEAEREATPIARPKKKVKEKHARAKFGLKPGDAISVAPQLFDGKKPGSYSKDNPDRQYGTVRKVWAGRRLAQIEWIDGSKNLVKYEDLRVEKIKVDAALMVTIMMVNAIKAPKDPLDKDGWPRDFFEAMVSPDWREWVLAIKKEIASWNDFNAYTEIPFASRTPGSSIVPLGELFTRKRDLSFKFRQYLMGNLLKKGKDYDETFSSCISWDGIRWCAAVACATDKLIHGLDAVTGFLQAKEQFDLYAFLPSHGQYSSLSFEQLAVVRKKLLDLVQKDGVAGLKKFAAAHKKESRTNPKVCYRLNSSIYGAPSANHEWEMLFQHAHVNGCGLTLSEIEPSLYVKIEVDKNDEVSGWMIANVWTDDVRYFGTDEVIRKYEEELQKHVRVKLLGVPGEFVGTEFHQDLERGLCELKSPKYWEAALLKVGKYFKDGIKERFNPLSTYDEGVMQEEVTDEEFEAAKDLEYRELCGIVSYPAACTKLEMRYAVSVCGKHRSKWGIKQFKILKKVFEYGYTTRHMGIIYSKGLDAHGDNTTYCFADSGHSLPRSYGCTIAMMNGAVTSLSAKKHTLTATSTCHDELIEFSIAVNRMVGFRNIMCEMGLEQEEATTIYQDNEAAISIAMNRGSLSKQSRHIERRVLAARNKIEDGSVIPKYCVTARMLADLGTKALPDAQFVFLRDEINGYALVRQHHPSYPLPAYVSTRNKEIQK
jgi:hypothetical protein